MRKRVYIVLILIVICGICGCGAKEENIYPINDEQSIDKKENESESITNDSIVEEEIIIPESVNKEETSSGENGNTELEVEKENLNLQLENTINGTQMMDGQEVPVNLTVKINNIQKYEEANEYIFGENAELHSSPDMEYIVVTLDITYNDGELDEIYMAENDSTLPSAKLKFTLSDGDRNAEDVTSYLENSVYNLVIKKGETQQGAVAFLHKKNSTEPLCFTGFGDVLLFSLEK